MLHWEAWRRSNQSATRPVRPFYFAVLLGLSLLVSLYRIRNFSDSTGSAIGVTRRNGVERSSGELR